MPFTLCKSERRRIDELVDHVKDLSDIVDELRAEVEAIKICTKIDSKESLNGKRNRAECNTLHKLKRCLQKSFIPVFSRDPTSKMRKKCQQMFSQMPTIIQRPANLPDNKHPNHQNVPSSTYPKKDRSSKRSQISHTQYSNEAEAKRRKQNIPTSSHRRKNITNNSMKSEQLQISSSSSQSSKDSLKKPRRIYDPVKSSRKDENVGQLKRNTDKKKTTEAATTTISTPIKVPTPKQRLIDSETLQRQRSVTFVDRKKKIPLEKGSPMISSLSSSNIDYNVIHAKPKTDFNLKRPVNSAPSGPEVRKKKKKISRSAQCSIDCEYLKKPPEHSKNVHTSTSTYNLSPENKNIAAQKLIKTRRKGLSSKSTQTTPKLIEYTGEICPNERRRYCPKAKRSCFPSGSQSSLTSCSPKSISSFCLGFEELGEGLMYRYYKREAIPTEDKMKNKPKTKIKEEESDNVKKSRLFSSREPAKKGAKVINSKPRGNRRKRTYLISSDIPVKKIDETAQCNLDKEQTNSSSDGVSTFQKSELRQGKNTRKLKNYDGLPKGNKNHELRRNKQVSSPDKYDNYMPTSVSTNIQTEKFVPELEPRSNWTIQKRHKKPTQLTKLRKNTSSSSYVCTDETCSLTSDPQISRSDGSINSQRFNRNKKATKDFSASARL